MRGRGLQLYLTPPASAAQTHAPAAHGSGNPTIDAIGIHMNFGLSPGDEVIFDTRFEVSAVSPPAAVPLPAAGPLLAGGLALIGGLGARSRARRQARMEPGSPV